MKINKIIEKVLLGLIFLLPFIPFIVANQMFFPYITGKNFAFRILTILILGFWLSLAVMDKEYRPRRSILLGSFVVFSLVISIADFFGVYAAKSIWSNYERMEGLVTILHLLALFIVLGSFLREEYWFRLINFSLGTSFIMGLIGLNQLSATVTRIDATLGNSTYLGGYMLIHVFLAIYLLLRRLRVEHFSIEDKFYSVLYLLVAAFDFVVMYYTGTRGSLVGLVIGLVVLAICIAVFEKKNKILRKISFGFLILIVIGVGALASVKNTNFAKNNPLVSRFSELATLDLKTYAETAGKGRLIIWGMAMKGVKERPLLGWGQDNFSYVFSKYYDPQAYSQEQWFDRTHNVFLDWLISGGILGLLSYLSLFFVSLWLIWKRHEFSTVDKASFSGLIAAYFAHNFFVFDNLTSYIMIVIVLSYVHIVATSKNKSCLDKDLSRDAQHIIIFFVWVLILTGGYFINKNGYFENISLLDSMQTASAKNVPLDIVKSSFDKTLSYDSFGNKEALEQMASYMIRVINSEKNPEKKTSSIKYVSDKLLDQFSKDKDVRTVFFLASFYAQVGELEQSLKYLNLSNELSPNKPSLLLNIVQIKAGQKDYQGAAEMCKKIYNLAPKYIDGVNNCILLYGQIGATAEVEKIISEQKELIDNNPQLRTTIMVALKQWDKLVSLFEQNSRIYAEAKQTPPADFLMSFATAYLKVGERVKAIKVLEDLKKYYPTYGASVDRHIEIINSGGNPIEE